MKKSRAQLAVDYSRAADALSAASSRRDSWVEYSGYLTELRVGRLVLPVTGSIHDVDRDPLLAAVDAKVQSDYLDAWTAAKRAREELERD